MSNVNSVTVSGNLCADPEFKEVSAEFQVCNMRLATNRSKKNKETNEYEDEASYFDVTTFGKFAALCAKKLSVGSAVTVQGRLEQQRWETEEGNRSKVVIIATEIDGQDFYKPGGELPDSQDPLFEGPTETAPPSDDDIPF